MNREDVEKQLLNSPGTVLCELPSGFGKSLLALKYIDNKLCTINNPKILIAVPKLVLINNWKKEILNWGYEKYIPNIQFVTYKSLPKMAGKWDITVLDECFKGTTEVLTEHGYIPFSKISSKDKVAQFTDDGTIEFVKPIRLIKRHHTGKICKVHLGRKRYVYMTPNHNQVYKTKSDNTWKMKEIQNLSFNSITELPVSGKGTGNNSPLTALERLLIAIQADGTLQRHQINESTYSIQVKKDRKKERLLNLLKDYNNYTTIKSREGINRYIIKVPKGDAKMLSTHFTINMGYNRAKSFIDEVLNWDGSYLIGNTRYYSSKIKENADFVAAVAIQAGYKVLQSIETDTRKETYSAIHRVYMRPDTAAVSSRVMNKEYLDYDDEVYCVEVPSHKIVVRSEGYTFISGNCHHFSERCRDAFADFDSKYTIMLSATVKKEIKEDLKCIFPDLHIIHVSTKNAIIENILPDPKVFLIPLSLNDTNINYQIIKNSSQKTELHIPYSQRFKYSSIKNRKIIIDCTQKQYYDNMSSTIEWCRNKIYMEIFKNMYLKKSGDRLKWLSDQKSEYIKEILFHLQDHRTLTFCNSITQTEELGKYCINSKNKKSAEYLNKFNTGEINHITSCNMLDEGINLTDCQIGIYAVLNSSERLIIQKLGRLLRHKYPVIVIPYYKNTREERIVNKMLENYNPALVTVITDLNQLKL